MPLTPITRKEIYLAKASGDYSGDLPEAITREEKYLKKIAENGSGGGGDSGTTNYNELENKPRIGGITLVGNKTLSDLGINIPDVSNFITDTEVEELLADYVPETVFDGTIAGFYTKSETDALLTTKADKTTTYTKTETDTLLASKADKSTTYTKAEVDTAQSAQNARIDWLQHNIETIRVMMDAVLYGYRVNKNDSNPETRVEYMYDAVGMTPARMDYTAGTFDYGSWGDAWFITENKPVALLYNGSVDYELDPDDYTKKADGTESDVSDSTYTGNFMASMPTVWIKRWEDDNYYYVAISNKQITPDFYADAHDAGDGTINPYIYLPMFKGTIVDGKMRSIAGVTPQGETSGSEEKTAAEACGSGWQIWDWSKHELISDLLTLISRSTDSQGAFGQGDTNTYDSSDATTYGKLTTGTSGAGQFWGVSDELHHVKVFHIEDFWGNRWDRCLGLNLVNMEHVYKPARPYSLVSDSSYTKTGLTAPASGWQIMQSVGRFGTLPKTVGGSRTTYFCDYLWSSTGARLGLFGGTCGNAAYCGSRYIDLNNASDYNRWNVGGSLCFNRMPSE